MTVLIIGGSGFLGTELVRLTRAAGHDSAATFATRPGGVPGVAWHRLDLRDAGRIADVMTEVTPTVVINASSGNADWAVTADGAVRVAMTTAVGVL
ncbi:NAD-dependent epimerase/dehydratase family protein [Streptomyces niveus]|uniref:NAD-dependent epimerase/dehydratase family protein n=1 Tax=Streptomyces niveus TaxID=193462 RepID=UPI00340044BA